MTTRCLYRPDRETWPSTSVVPKPHGRAAIETRNTLGQFLEATLMRPLHFDETRQQERVDQALDTMTWAERITIEIELQRRNTPVHSVDYDPLT